MSDSNFQVLLYYKYVKIDNPVGLMRAQRRLCEDLGLKGRIIIAKEGINGTVEGTMENTTRYMSLVREDPRFSDINFKVSEGSGMAFPKLSIKVRNEIVTSEVPNLNPNRVTGKYLSSEELHSWFLEGKEFYVVDMRNDYEYSSGFFKGSLFSEFKNFKDLHTIIPKLEHLKEKTLVTVCTGGVRCEKASGFLVANGFRDVYQLKDGIQTYMEKFPNQHFKGKLYVFDNRLTIGFNTDSPDHEIVGRCNFCQKPSDLYVNCAENTCHKHYICCIECRDPKSGLAFCDEHCKTSYYFEAKAASA